MPTNLRLDLAYILHDDVITDFLPSFGRQQWQVVYGSRDADPDTFGIFCALLPSGDVAAALAHESWDMSIGDGLPGFSQSSKQETRVTSYQRFGGFDKTRPLVIRRHFHGAWPPYIEICEEFRHFHDLAEDHERGILLDFDRSGYPIEVVRIQDRSAEIQLPYLLRFLAATRPHLAFFVDVIRYSLIPLEDIPEGRRELKHADDRSRYFRHVVECDFRPEYRTFHTRGRVSR